MDTTAILVTITASLISGLLATMISNWYYSSQQKRQLKLELLKNIIGYSYQATNIYNDTACDFVVYLNQIYIIFNSSKSVLDALGEYKKNSSVDNFITLIKKMCDDVNVEYKSINDSFIESPFVLNRKRQL